MNGLPFAMPPRAAKISRFASPRALPCGQTGAVAMVVVLVLSMLGLALGLYTAHISRIEVKMAVDDTLDKQALDVAQAGLIVAGRLIANHGVPNDELAGSGVGTTGSGLAGVGSVQTLASTGASYRYAAFGGGGYYVRAEDNHDEISGSDDRNTDLDQIIDVISVGVVGAAQRTVKGELKVPMKWGAYAISNSPTSFQLSGYAKMGYINCQQSPCNAYVGTPGTLAMQQYAVVNGVTTVGGDINMSGYAQFNGSTNVVGNLGMIQYSKITGSLAVDGTVSATGSYPPSSWTTNAALFPPALPSLTACGSAGPPSTYSNNSGITISGTSSGYNQSTGNLSVGGHDTVSLAPGTYCFNNVTISQYATFNISGPGLTTINLTGSMAASGYVTTVGATAANLKVNVFGGGAVTLSQYTTYYMTLYAPQSAVALSGYAVLNGTVVANTINLQQYSQVIQDLSLQNADTEPLSTMLSNWRQVLN